MDDGERAAYGRAMGNPHSEYRTLRVVALVLTGAVVAWAFGRKWTDDDVGDPGVSL